MARSIERAIAQGKERARKNSRLDLNHNEIATLMDKVIKAEPSKKYEAIFEVIGDAYYMGFGVGSRNA